MTDHIQTQVVVIGGGPAGYSAAFRAADLGLQTTIVEHQQNLGGVCLNVGCIPSKALLHVAKILEEMKELKNNNIVLSDPQINLEAIRNWKQKVIYKLSRGLSSIAINRKVPIIQGTGNFSSANTLEVIAQDGSYTTITFNHAIIATGSSPIKISGVPYHDERIWDSTSALKLNVVPEKLLIIGGGIIGLEIASIYYSLGSQIEIIEMSTQLIPSVDTDIIQLFTRYISKRFKIILESKVTSVTAEKDGIYVTMTGKQAPVDVQRYDAVLIAIGRSPNGGNCRAEKAGVQVDKAGFIPVNNQMRTNVSHIFSVGDVVGQPMLAHKGMHEGHIAAEVIFGKKYYFDPKVIPCIAYTDPEIAWVGVTEKDAKEKNICYEVSTFPWSASGRALASNCTNGITKLIFDKKTHRVIGGAIIGSNGGELLGEIGLAIEMGCDVADIALTIHAHPTLHESIGLAAQVFEGSITDILNLKCSTKY
ncbi:Dihydrolipoyl dehydrogenase [Candidatus Erwinia haradaeae]|uniref:Dihydrolipoyl dehydrogenase n=2 Tax=Candidatus Erwinia haradaeae TaxID=1922217 RepID=A0A451DHJ3_9GAMM|nr:Dihydrolipoyl dehydrogenase [Candidatus Erwinia haradaeae]